MFSSPSAHNNNNTGPHNKSRHIKMFSKKKKKIEISAPSNFQHRVHTRFDNPSNKYVGLPKQWASLVVDEAGSVSPHRPTPMVDPSAITPTDILDMKTVVRGSQMMMMQTPNR